MGMGLSGVPAIYVNSSAMCACTVPKETRHQVK